MLKKKLRGFTIIELMIVVAMIGILASVVLPKFGPLVEKTKIGEAKTNLAALRTALGIYHMENDSYTTDLDDLDVTIPTSGYYSYSIALSGSGTTATFTMTAERSGGNYDGGKVIMSATGNITYGEAYASI